MKISKLIKLLEKEMAREGDMQIFIYDRRGDRIAPKCVKVGSICKGTRISDYAYISDLK